MRFREICHFIKKMIKEFSSFEHLKNWRNFEAFLKIIGVRAMETLAMVLCVEKGISNS